MMLLPERSSFELSEENVNEDCLTVYDEFVLLKAGSPLRTMSSGVIGSGTGWHDTFVNRHVDRNYNCSNHREEMAGFLKENGFDPSDTVGMMTAVEAEDVVFQLYEEMDFSVLVVVTAGVGNAVDVSKSHEHEYQVRTGTINTWLFINGELTEEAFIQCIMTATEAKVKVLHDLEVKDANTGTLATGTSTDSILIAATQKGKQLEFAGTITPLGKLIGKGVYECTLEAIQKSSRRRARL